MTLRTNGWQRKAIASALVVGLFAGCIYPEYTEMERTTYNASEGKTAGTAGTWGSNTPLDVSGAAGARELTAGTSGANTANSAGRGVAGTSVAGGANSAGSGATGASGASGVNDTGSNAAGTSGAAGYLNGTAGQTSCGNGFIDSEAGEECDLGDANNLPDADAYSHQGACTTSCKRAPFCGDQIPDKDHGEECDGSSNCNVYCRSETCGRHRGSRRRVRRRQSRQCR